MACVTLKRSLDFDPLHSPNRPNKRRRCAPIHCATEPSKPQSVFKESPLTPEQIANNLRDEIKRLKKRRQLAVNAGSPPSSPEPMMDTDHLAAASQIATSFASGSSSKQTVGSESSASTASSSNSTAAILAKHQDKPIFTLKQMTMIAERMCRERVEQVKEEYDQILQQKLAEQYDSFVKFIDHQIQRRFSESQVPSYLS